MEYVACLVLCFQYCYQEIKISQLNISSKSGNSKTKLSINSRAETNCGGWGGGTGDAYLYQLQQPLPPLSRIDPCKLGCVGSIKYQ